MYPKIWHEDIEQHGNSLCYLFFGGFGKNTRVNLSVISLVFFFQYVVNFLLDVNGYDIPRKLCWTDDYIVLSRLSEIQVNGKWQFS